MTEIKVEIVNECQIVSSVAIGKVPWCKNAQLVDVKGCKSPQAEEWSAGVRVGCKVTRMLWEFFVAGVDAKGYRAEWEEQYRDCALPAFCALCKAYKPAVESRIIRPGGR